MEIHIPRDPQILRVIETYRKDLSDYSSTYKIVGTFHI